MSSDPLCLVFVPALAAVLTAAESKKKKAPHSPNSKSATSETKPPALQSPLPPRWLWNKSGATRISLLRIAGMSGNGYVARFNKAHVEGLPPQPLNTPPGAFYATHLT